LSEQSEILFEEFTHDHLLLLKKWLCESHVAEFWQEPEDENELRDKFLRKLREQGVRPYIIYSRGQPIGYIQDYEAHLVGGGWWPDAIPGTFGVDQFIGDPELVNRGLGTIIIHKFVCRIFEIPSAIEVIADPSPNNLRAIRAYEKVGFKPFGEIQTPGGTALLMKLRREDLALEDE
jgi:RimJ/RimL family protein N-acetyltransferase